MTRVPHFRPALVAVALLAPFLAPLDPLTAQDAPGGLRGDLLADLDVLQEKYVGLAEAIPAEKYDWRPAEGVRSVSEVFTHVVNATYYFPGLMGVDRPADIGMADPPQNLEEVTDKEQVVAILGPAFEHLRGAIAGVSDEDLDNAVTLFGQESTVRGLLLLIQTHMHEHLGQSIAYARSVGTTPPWSRSGDGS